MKVSVCIPVYNGAETLARALESVEKQTYRDFEIVVIDDGSVDDSAEIARGFGGARVLTQANRGVGATRQRLIESAEGEWVAFLDADDAWIPTKLEEQVAVANSKDVVLVNGWCRTHSANGGQSVREIKIPDWSCPLDHLLPDNTVVTSSAMIRRDVLLAAGFKEGLRMAEDWLAWFKVASFGDFALLPKVLTERYERPGSESAPTLAWFRAERRVLEEFVLPEFDRWYARFPFEVRERMLRRAKRKLGLIASLEALHLDLAGERSNARLRHVEALRSAPTKGAVMRFVRHLTRI